MIITKRQIGIWKGEAYLIELQTGKITFPELNITVSPLLHYADFISDFPKDKIHTNQRYEKWIYMVRYKKKKFMTTKSLFILLQSTEKS